MTLPADPVLTRETTAMELKPRDESRVVEIVAEYRQRVLVFGDDHATEELASALEKSERVTALAINMRDALRAQLTAAQQERDAAQKAMSYASNQAHLEWTRAEKAEALCRSHAEEVERLRKELETLRGKQ